MKTCIRAIYTPEKHTEEKGVQPDPEKAVRVLIIGFSQDGGYAISVDKEGKLRRGNLHQFVCNFFP